MSMKDLTISVPSALLERLETYAGPRSVGRIARECLLDGFGRRLANGVPAVRHANPAKSVNSMPLCEESRDWWEKFAKRNLVPRKVAAFLLGRSATYVTQLARAMEVDGWKINVAEARAWLEAHPEFRVSWQQQQKAAHPGRRPKPGGETEKPSPDRRTPSEP